MKKFLIVTSLLIVTFVTLVLTGCSIDTSGGSSPDKATPSYAAKPTAKPEKKDGPLKFGDAMTWNDGLSLSISEPVPFTPGEFAMGKGDNNIVFTMVLTNNTKKAFEPSPYITISSGGSEAVGIFDMSNPVGNIGNIPQTTILPGQSITWLEGFAVKDLSSITLEATPSFEYKKTIFTNLK